MRRAFIDLWIRSPIRFAARSGVSVQMGVAGCRLRLAFRPRRKPVESVGIRRLRRSRGRSRGIADSWRWSLKVFADVRSNSLQDGGPAGGRGVLCITITQLKQHSNRNSGGEGRTAINAQNQCLRAKVGILSRIDSLKVCYSPPNRAAKPDHRSPRASNHLTLRCSIVGRRFRSGRPSGLRRPHWTAKYL